MNVPQSPRPRGNPPNSPHRKEGARRRSRSSKGWSSLSTGLATAVGFGAATAVAAMLLWSGGCGGEPPPGASTDKPARVSYLPPPGATSAVAAPSGAPTVAEVADAGAGDAEAAPDPDKPYTGPLLGALAIQTPVYPAMKLTKERLGYIRLGGKVPVDPKPLKAENCPSNWYRLLDGGYVCAKYATLDMSNAALKMGITSPNLEEILPYKYAYNTAHGTPLYKSVPSKEDMYKYEPYLEAAKKAKKKAEKEAQKEAPADDPDAGAPATASSVYDELDGGAPPLPSANLLDAGPADEEPAKPWWQQNEPGKPLNVKLSDLESDADGTVAKRMVKGFFVAVDKTFGWNNRAWYKTTAGLVAPSDRMYIVKPPSSKGIDVPDGVKQVGFITAAKAAKYTWDPEKKKITVSGSVARFSAFGLTGQTISKETIVYRQTTEGWWMKAIDGTYAEPSPAPSEVKPGEKWIDVNLSRKTLLAMEGDKPVYAALISPGRRSKNKKKDHPTVQGTFRIREKHVAVTMDGDGTVAGDLPYSIEDVPYVAYFEGSYALHAAFWHNNFGREMSHGCVNLSPLDAKKVFFWAEPKLPRGWHAVWASAENKGTVVHIHE
ncbi:MAG: L,D-transpeptidase [Polyangiaceae bacterium]|nr:L,D-transpeptidase [Polyangiaceae bacterium]